MTTCANCGGELQPAWKYCIACGTRTTVPLVGAGPASIDPAAEGPRRLNMLAVLALVLGCLLSPLAALFGHVALAQLRATGERGAALAWIGVVLGYVWLVVFAVLLIATLTTNG